MICSNGPVSGLAMQQKSDAAQPDIVAVGTALAGGPPHGSGRAELLHPALALGNNANAGRKVRMITTFTPILHPRLTYPLKRAGHALPALGPVHVTLKQIPLGQPPSLHHLLGLRLGLVRRLQQYYGTVRLPMPVHHRRASLDFPMRSGVFSPQTDTGSPGSRSRCLRACTGSQTARSPKASRDIDAPSFAFRIFRQRRHPEVATASTVGFQFRGSIPGLYVPLSTLHLRPCGRRCMTRSRCGLLILHRMKLSFTTTCRFLPAHRNPKQTRWWNDGMMHSGLATAYLKPDT